MISDNYDGARMLTEAIIARFGPDDPLRPDEFICLAGATTMPAATGSAAFHATKTALLGMNTDG